ncbi:hypothetical protein B7486_49175 [cyanobacterium TDX16]|nr:hypothetical protein B7486_49175 [cyanobacterium TDX16]
MRSRPSRSLLRLLFILTLFLTTALSFVLPEITLSAIQPSLPNAIEESEFSSYISKLNNLTFSTLPAISELGEFVSRPEWNKIAGYNLSRTWKAGQTADLLLKLGDVQDAFGLENLTLTDIATRSLASYELNQTALSAFELLGWQSLGDLATAVPQLKNFLVADVPPIRDLLRSRGINVSKLTIAEILKQYPEAKRLLLGNINLDEFALTDIPNLALTKIGNFRDWKDAFVAGVPGLNTVPLANMIGFLFSPGMLGVVDIAYGTAESDRDNTITGSYKQGFKVPCQKKCAYVELAGAPPLYARSPVYGKQWISGKYQKVRGGHGILGQLNNGLEPTGRHPFGKAFKLVVWEIDEATGTVETALFFRTCGSTGLGCSPYIFGPIPFINFHEKDLFFLIGKLDGFGTSGQGIPTEDKPDPSNIPPASQAPQTEPPKEPECQSRFIHPAPGYPVPGTGGRFGACRPLGACTRRHKGIDLATPIGIPVRASESGIVSFVGLMQGYGLTVDIKHCSYSTRYAHLSKALVLPGAKVTQGEVVAESGNTGVGSGAHLHFEIRRGGSWGEALDPENFIRF